LGRRTRGICRFPYAQLGFEDNEVAFSLWLRVVLSRPYFPKKHFHRSSAEFKRGLCHRGQPGTKGLTPHKVIKADNADLARAAHSKLAEGAHQAQGHAAITPEDCSRRLGGPNIECRLAEVVYLEELGAEPTASQVNLLDPNRFMIFGCRLALMLPFGRTSSDIRRG